MRNLRFINSYAFIVCLAAGLRFTSLTFDSFWLDESFQTMHDAMGYPPYPIVFQRGEPVLYKMTQPQPLEQVLANFGEVNLHSPPLYALVLNRWMCLLNYLGIDGISDASVRSLSAVFSTLSVCVTIIGGAIIFGPLVGCLAGLLAAISPFDIYYAQEARPYAMEILLANVSSLSFIYLLLKRKEDVSFKLTLALYSASTWALINTHYTALFLVAAQGMGGLAFCYKRRNGRLFGWLMLAWSAAWMSSLPWAKFLLHTSETTEGSYIARESSSWWPLYGLLCRIPYDWLSFLAGKRVAAYAFPAYATSLTLIATGILATALRNQLNVRWLQERTPKLALLIWCTVPPLLLWSIDCAQSRKVIEISRYMACIAPGVFLLAALGLALLLRKNFKASKWIIVAHVVFCVANLFYIHTVHQRTPWKEMAAKVEEKVSADDVLFVSQYFDVICLDRYLTRPFRQIGISPHQGREHTQRLMNSEMPNLHKFWLVTCDDGIAVTTQIPNRFHEREKIVMAKNLILSRWEE